MKHGVNTTYLVAIVAPLAGVGCGVERDEDDSSAQDSVVISELALFRQGSWGGLGGSYFSV